MPDHLIVIRSGATDYDLQGRIRGTLDIPLCDAGRAEAARAAATVAAAPPDALYSSAAACAVETARIVAAACGGLRTRRVFDLHNLDQGLWQGMLVDEIRRKQPRLHRQWQDNPWAVAPPQGELLAEACERVETALEKIIRRHPAGRVALVVPQPLDRVVRWLVSGESMGDLWQHEAGRPPLDVLPVAAQWQPSRRRRMQPS